MDTNVGNESLVGTFIFETLQLIEQLEQVIINSENSKIFDDDSVNEIFRIMHTIKGAASMMEIDNITTLAHSMEDLFYYLREENPDKVDYTRLTDIILKCSDFIKNQIGNLENNKDLDGNPSAYIDEIKSFLNFLEVNNFGKKSSDASNSSEYVDPNQSEFNNSNEGFFDEIIENTYEAHVYFEEGCLMENMRAFTLVRDLSRRATEIRYFPEDIDENDKTELMIREKGFKIRFDSELDFEQLEEFFYKVPFLKSLNLNILQDGNEVWSIKEKPIKGEIHILDENEKGIIDLEPIEKLDFNTEEKSNNALNNIEDSATPALNIAEASINHNKQSVITVNVDKLDKLMDLVGELVIAEAMVTQNMDLQEMNSDNFHKASRQLKKISSELQDIVMSIRMVPLTLTFQKMNRIVRDMNKKLSKEVTLEIIGAETEVDKNIIEHIADPLMHLIRNAIDHGIETKGERIKRGKKEKSKVVLQAKSAGGDVWIIVKDNGRGLDKNKILEKAKANGLLSKPESDLTDKEIYSYILLPGFSTNKDITEFSGRGVGMDVVLKSVENIGGNILIDSVPGEGTTISLKIPLTMAIIKGINIKVGDSRYTVPTTAIRECFKPKKENLVIDPDGNEMIMVRGECFNIIRLHKLYKVKTDIQKIEDGIIVIVENSSKTFCIFCDNLIGEQEVVVKALPSYIKKVDGIGGCTLLGDGSISLILDIAGLGNC